MKDILFHSNLETLEEYIKVYYNNKDHKLFYYINLRKIIYLL